MRNFPALVVTLLWTMVFFMAIGPLVYQNFATPEDNELMQRLAETPLNDLVFPELLFFFTIGPGHVYFICLLVLLTYFISRVALNISSDHKQECVNGKRSTLSHG